MSRKRLHVHSLPLLLLTVAAVVTLALPAAIVQTGVTGAASALLRPVARLEASDRGYVKVVVNRPIADEQSGVWMELPQQGQTVTEAHQALDSIGLQLALNHAVR